MATAAAAGTVASMEPLTSTKSAEQTASLDPDGLY